MLNTIDQWISEGSGWTIDRIDNHYLNVMSYKPFNESNYIEPPIKLRNAKKGLINVKNDDNRCFLWCHVRHLSPQETNPQRVKKEDKEFANKLDYSGIDFPVSSKSYSKIEKQNNIRINVFGYENNEPFLIYISEEKFEDQMNLLLITKDEKKHYVIIKDFNCFMYNQMSHKRKKHFCMYCLQNFTTETIPAKHVENCMVISGVQ